MNLHSLAIAILAINKEPISKVKFAKSIYFVHKKLVNSNLASVDDIQYVRMPLGPVPFGFMALDSNYSDIVVTENFSGLFYNSKFYGTNTNIKDIETNEDTNQVIKKVLANLRDIGTSELVEISHKDDSWIMHQNGYVFTLSEKDLSNPVPENKSAGRLHSDDQLLQANLVKGMIEDIVNESTNLEYPTDYGEK